MSDKDLKNNLDIHNVNPSKEDDTNKFGWNEKEKDLQFKFWVLPSLKQVFEGAAKAAMTDRECNIEFIEIVEEETKVHYFVKVDRVATALFFGMYFQNMAQYEKQ